MAVPSSSMTGCSVVLEVPRSAWARLSEIAPELRRQALVVAALVDDRLAHGWGQTPADQILRRVAERAEDEEVEDDDRRPASRVRSQPGERRTVRSLLSPLEGLGPPVTCGDESRAEDCERNQHRADQHRARRRQPAVVGARRGHRMLPCLGHGRGAGLQGEESARTSRTAAGPVGAGDGFQPCQVSLRRDLDRVEVHERQVRQVAAARLPRPGARRRPRRPASARCARPASALSKALLA